MEDELLDEEKRKIHPCPSFLKTNKEFYIIPSMSRLEDGHSSLSSSTIDIESFISTSQPHRL